MENIVSCETGPVPVMDAKYFSSQAMNLLLKPEKGPFLKSTPFKVLDAHGNQQLKLVKGDSLLMNTERLILEANDSPITLRRHKTFSRHNVWRVYKGKDAREEAALFQVMKRQDGLALDVCMASIDNSKKEKNMASLPRVEVIEIEMGKKDNIDSSILECLIKK